MMPLLLPFLDLALAMLRACLASIVFPGVS
jgi:hypothetical protein